MDDRFLRNEMMFGSGMTELLSRKSVAVFGVGGVGGCVVEALARAGTGSIDIIDSDIVDITNINRQIIALESTLGRPKVEVMKERILDINPACKVKAMKIFYLPENADAIDFSSYDYVVDAVDTVTAKLAVISGAKAAGVPVISAMGAGNKLDPTRFSVSDISKTAVDPLARIIRLECRKRGLGDFKVVCSTEQPVKSGEKSVPASNPFVPPVVGFIIAGEVIKDLARG